jgi:TetR/AcrR family transcriptional regulator, fatty acid metabolism regulator protein
LGIRNDTENRRTRVARKKMKKILRAAVKVFAKYGFYKSRISRIAKTAGVADGTVYIYFKNKDDILIRVFEEHLQQIILDRRAELSSIDDPREKLRHFVQEHLLLVRTNRNLAEVLSVELRQSHQFMNDYRPEKFGEYLNILSGIIREGQNVGVFRTDLMPGIIKRAIFGALDELSVFLVLADKPDYDLETVIEQTTNYLLQGLQEFSVGNVRRLRAEQRNNNEFILRWRGEAI